MFFKYIIKKKGKINKIKALHFVYCVFEAALRSNDLSLIINSRLIK